MTAADAGDVALRDMRPDGIEGGLRLCRLAGWNQREADWQTLLAHGLMRVAVRGDAIIGSGGAVQYGRRLAWVAMILVDPAERGRGIATRLVGEILERLRGIETVGLDSTPEGVPVYTRHGFTDRSGLVRMERPAAPLATALAESRAVAPLQPADLDALAGRDRSVFGADRMSVLRWAQAQAPEYAWRLAEAGRAPSYIFGRHGHRTEHLGPVVAEDDDAAASLVVAALKSRAEGCFTIDVPDRPAWVERLERLGFGVQRPFRRMLLGPGPAPGKLESLYAVFGPEFG